MNVGSSNLLTRFFVNRFETLGYPPSPRPPSAILDATEALGETHMAAMQNAAPVMDAAFVVSIKTRHDRTERQSPDQHAANRDASWFICSVMVFGLSNSRVKMVDWICPINMLQQAAVSFVYGEYLSQSAAPAAALLNSSSESCM